MVLSECTQKLPVDVLLFFGLLQQINIEKSKVIKNSNHLLLVEVSLLLLNFVNLPDLLDLCIKVGY